MTDPQPSAYRATADDWLNAETMAAHDSGSYYVLRCILELRAKVEALEAGATCPHIRSSDEGTSYCALAEQTAAPQPAAPAPTNPIVEQVRQDLYFTTQRGARKAIREMATVGYSANPFNPVREQAEHHGWLAAFAWLEQKANQ